MKLVNYLASTLPQKQHKNKDITFGLASNGKKYIECTFYGRVSTKVQTEENKSGFDRQLTKLDHFKSLNPHVKVTRVIEDAISGSTPNRFNWLIEGLENGTIARPHILFFAEVTRFSRESPQIVLRTIDRLVEAGVQIVCPEVKSYTETLDFDEDLLTLAVLIKMSHKEYLEKSGRMVGSLTKKQKQLERGDISFFTRRGEGSLKKDYPCWLNYNPDLKAPKDYKITGGWWDQDEKLVAERREVYKLIPEMGMRRTANHMAEKGMMDVKKSRPVNLNDIVAILNNRAVLGYKVETHNRKKTKTGKEYLIYPPIITQKEYDLAQQGKSTRDAPRPNKSNGSTHKNLFEGRLFCAECGSVIGVRTSQKIGDKEYLYMNCNGKERKEKCNSIGTTRYYEDKLLDKFQDFHWDKYFNDKKHDQNIINKRKSLQEFEGKLNQINIHINNYQKTIREAAKAGQDISFLYEDIAKEKEDKKIAKDKCTRIQYELDMLEKQKKGKARAKDIKNKINDFRNSDKENIENRKKFINWLHSENLVMTFDFNWDGTPFSKGGIGIGKYDYNSGKLIDINSTIESLVAFGMDPENAEKEYIKVKEREENIKAEKEAFAQTPEGKRWAKFKKDKKEGKVKTHPFSEDPKWPSLKAAYKSNKEKLHPFFKAIAEATLRYEKGERWEKPKSKTSIGYKPHGCLTPPDWKGEDNNAYLKYWEDIERKAGRVTNVGYPIKWLDSQMEIKYIDLENKYEYFAVMGIKYNKSEYKKLDVQKINAIREKLLYQKKMLPTNTLKEYWEVRAKKYD
mgnify:CR=1 FL=1